MIKGGGGGLYEFGCSDVVTRVSERGKRTKGVVEERGR